MAWDANLLLGSGQLEAGDTSSVILKPPPSIQISEHSCTGSLVTSVEYALDSRQNLNPPQGRQYAHRRAK